MENQSRDLITTEIKIFSANGTSFPTGLSKRSRDNVYPKPASSLVEGCCFTSFYSDNNSENIVENKEYNRETFRLVIFYLEREPIGREVIFPSDIRKW